jgi:hypothetical protein
MTAPPSTKNRNVKRLFVLTTMAALSVPALAAVSVNVGEPHFYGRIDIGGVPEPELVYREPVVIQPAPADVVREPIYLHVPPGQERNWRKNCRRYNACGHPVYFVRDDWYNREYVPRYRERHGEHRGDDGANHQGDGRGDEHDRSRGDDQYRSRGDR